MLHVFYNHTINVSKTKWIQAIQAQLASSIARCRHLHNDKISMSGEYKTRMYRREKAEVFPCDINNVNEVNSIYMYSA